MEVPALWVPAIRDPNRGSRIADRVADGTRTRDRRDHNPELYQLSYRHRARGQDTVHPSKAP